jgi:dihydroorotase
MNYILLQNATIVNQNDEFTGSILIQKNKIAEVYHGEVPENVLQGNIRIIDCTGKHIIPGVIDDQVHFREPGLTHKGTIATESKAAIAGGVTSFMEMPNVNPQTTTIQNLEQKLEIASNSSFANYSFYLGATNDNIDQLRALDPTITCGVKVFMGSSTGNMLVDNPKTLQQIFSDVKIPIATHCEDEGIIQANIALYKQKYGDDIPLKFHPIIRSREACFKSSKLAYDLAKKYGTRLHILHLSTAEEMSLFESGNVKEKQITAEVCVHHLWFSSKDYEQKGAFIKWNPAIKEESDRIALFEALLDDRIDIIATDHAPHTIEEKTGVYTKAASGGPLVQHSLLAMIDFYKQGIISLPRIVQKMCHAPADLFGVKNRGYIKKGFYADLVILNLQAKTKVTKKSILYKCGWSPFEDYTFSSKIEKTILNGNIVYDNGCVDETRNATSLEFSR